MIVIILLLISAFSSFKLAEEKGQNKIIWTAATLFVGPVVLAVQYLVSWYNSRNVLR
ncbi:hypothetical protein R0131_11725 [Clostridium sp. AL.422]|uniref:hypothetical protein n=1 Tax=Clostridium TaxID=1485 RepID=UPI00293DEC6E|nr:MULTISPECIES: hypothetical protein [unclassified Clostridium]MDV4151496.1 hypothetical protein [Clostridium sp. AL.422]